MTQHQSETEWMPVVTIERTVTIGEQSIKTAVDISGYGASDAVEIVQAFIRATEDA